jgi:hypothetical protein
MMHLPFEFLSRFSAAACGRRSGGRGDVSIGRPGRNQSGAAAPGKIDAK